MSIDFERHSSCDWIRSWIESSKDSNVNDSHLDWAKEFGSYLWDQLVPLIKTKWGSLGAPKMKACPFIVVGGGPAEYNIPLESHSSCYSKRDLRDARWSKCNCVGCENGLSVPDKAKTEKENIPKQRQHYLFKVASWRWKGGGYTPQAVWHIISAHKAEHPPYLAACAWGSIVRSVCVSFWCGVSCPRLHHPRYHVGHQPCSRFWNTIWCVSKRKWKHCL